MKKKYMITFNAEMAAKWGGIFMTCSPPSASHSETIRPLPPVAATWPSFVKQPLDFVWELLSRSVSLLNFILKIVL